MPAHRKPRLLPVDPGPSPESLAACAYGAVKVREAGRLIGKSRAYVYELVKAGRLEAFPHGRDTVVPLTSIQVYLAEVRDAGRDQSRVEIGLRLHAAKKKRAKR